jgi:hypothetical protein
MEFERKNVLILSITLFVAPKCLASSRRLNRSSTLIGSTCDLVGSTFFFVASYSGVSENETMTLQSNMKWIEGNYYRLHVWKSNARSNRHP